MGIQHVFIIGSKGIPAKYGGFETFVEKLTEYTKDRRIQYHIACMRENSKKSGFMEDFFVYNQAECINIDVPNIGPAKAIVYDILSLQKAISMATERGYQKPIFYVLACRIGPFIHHYKKIIAAMGGYLWVNPDGHEWLRQKWSKPVRMYWKASERLMVKYADLLVCDNRHIERYIQTEYAKYAPKTTYIAYGTDLTLSALTHEEEKVATWFHTHSIQEGEYYLVVGRFVPENNIETIIRAFMQADTKKALVLITNVEKNRFYKSLAKKTAFPSDSRIKFVGTLYDGELLKYVREHAFAYIHGHEVGGTNPSLLEALATSPLNLLLDVGFNQEVGGDYAMYWKKDNLTGMIEAAERLSPEVIADMAAGAKAEVARRYSWEYIVSAYESIWSEVSR